MIPRANGAEHVNTILDAARVLSDLKSGAATLTLTDCSRGHVEWGDWEMTDEDAEPTCYVEAYLTITAPDYFARAAVWSSERGWKLEEETGFEGVVSKGADIIIEGADRDTTANRTCRRITLDKQGMTAGDTKAITALLSERCGVLMRDLQHRASDYYSDEKAEQMRSLTDEGDE